MKSKATIIENVPKSKMMMKSRTAYFIRFKNYKLHSRFNMLYLIIVKSRTDRNKFVFLVKIDTKTFFHLTMLAFFLFPFPTCHYYLSLQKKKKTFLLQKIIFFVKFFFGMKISTFFDNDFMQANGDKK